MGNGWKRNKNFLEKAKKEKGNSKPYEDNDLLCRM